MSTNSILKNWWKYLITVVVGFGIGILVNIPSCQQSNTEYITVHDTTYIPQERIVEKTKVKYVTLVDTFLVTVPGDTVYIDIPIDYKEYRDTIKTDSTSVDLKINYHGWNSDIDSIRLNYTFSSEREVIQPKRFGWSICAGPYIGYGINLTPTNPMQVNHGFEVGIGVMVGIDYRIK